MPVFPTPREGVLAQKLRDFYRNACLSYTKRRSVSGKTERLL
jgi:hypothetical protein